MKTSFASVPMIRLHPLRRAAVNKVRMNVDTIGLYMLKFSFLLGGALQGWLGPVLAVYNAAAFITVLTVDPSRLPEAATTRIHQKQAWLLLLGMTPVIAVMVGLLAWSGMLHLQLPSMLPPIGFLLTCYTDELLFRNILQPGLRRLGLSRWGAIIGQAVLFAVPFAVSGKPIGVVATLAVLGLVNGYIVYRHRSLWPAFALAIAVRILCFGN
jgi:membrane protease YdiL (CAAX protease family)